MESHAFLNNLSCLLNCKAESQPELSCKSSSWLRAESSTLIFNDSLIKQTPHKKDLKSILIQRIIPDDLDLDNGMLRQIFLHKPSAHTDGVLYTAGKNLLRRRPMNYSMVELCTEKVSVCMLSVN